MNLLTVCVPVYNEELFIDDLLHSLICTHTLDEEIVLIDGNSSDNTVGKIMQWKKNHPNIKLITNELRQVSHGFNLAYTNTDSKYIALIGAHALYPPNYFQLGVAILEKGITDAVGGSLRQIGRTRKGNVIAKCMNCRFGVGNAEIRVKKKREFVQSAAMAIYRREVFDKIGLMDEQLVRNQDDEFHYRMNSRGFKIMMEPEMEITYFVRDDFKSLWKQYYEYGLFKPLVLKKVRSGIRIRHLIPPVFVAYLITLPLLMQIHWLTILPLLFYLVLNVFFSVRLAGNAKDFFMTLSAFLVLHLSSGLGMIAGLKKLFRDQS